VIRIGIIAAEPSGDALAAGLMEALQGQLPGVRFEGVAGPQMEAVGIDRWASMDALSVMGLFEVLRDLPRLLRLRSRLVARWRDTPPALFIGVDAPDFNLGVEQRLRESGVPTVHYVSPSVWAWRTGRVRRIRRAVDLLLTILPFEAAFLARYGIKGHYVGHPLAAAMPVEPDHDGARQRLGLDPAGPVLAVLPGSRRGEVARLARPFIESAVRLGDLVSGLQVVTPLVNESTRAMFESAWQTFAGDRPVRLVTGGSRDALAAADVVLVASGTATLETLLSKRPMVVGYRTNPATYALVVGLGLIKTRHVALSNLLIGDEGPLAEELIQRDCVPARIVPALHRLFTDTALRDRTAVHYRAVHERLRMDSNGEAATAVVSLLRERGLV
jgi:lipid-A-disaccharide synthase